MTQREFAAAELRAAAVQPDDVQALRDFRCSVGTEWEQEVEDEIQQRLAQSNLDHAGDEGDARMLVVRDRATEEILGVAAHWAERAEVVAGDAVIELQVTYLEVIAVSLDARRSLVHLQDGGPPLSFGEFMYELALDDIRSRSARQAVLFARVDKRHKVSLDFCDRVGLRIERVNTGDPKYVQRWANI